MDDDGTEEGRREAEERKRKEKLEQYEREHDEMGRTGWGSGKHAMHTAHLMEEERWLKDQRRELMANNNNNNNFHSENANKMPDNIGGFKRAGSTRNEAISVDDSECTLNNTFDNQVPK
jgi:hypothetical protein